MNRTAQPAFDDQLASATFFADPYPLLHRMRREAPVYWSNLLNGWVLTRYEDVVSTLRDHRLLSSAGRMTILLDQLPQTMRENVRMVDAHYAATLPFLNPPDHTRIRGLVSKAFSPRVIEALRPEIQAIADGLLDRVQSQGRMDAIKEFAFPLPVTAISALMGVPGEDRDRFKRWTNEIFGIFASGRARPASTERGLGSLIETREYLAQLIAERRISPGQDLISHLIAVEEQENTLTAEYGPWMNRSVSRTISRGPSEKSLTGPKTVTPAASPPGTI